MIEFNKVHNMSCVDGMRSMEDCSVEMVCTSPPYDDLRTYNDSSKWDFEVFKSVAVEIVRVLKDGGVVMWNVGDATVNGGETGSSFRQALYFMDLGLRLHDTMIYEKTGIAFASGPKSLRYSQCFEYCFILSKGKPSTVNIIMDKPNVWAGAQSWGKKRARKKDGELAVGDEKTKAVREFGARNNIWRIKNSGGFGQSNKKAYEHPATMPEELSRDHILSWTKEGDVVLDPFMGSGTTARMSILTGRQYVGFEIDPTYYELCNNITPQNILEW